VERAVKQQVDEGPKASGQDQRNQPPLSGCKFKLYDFKRRKIIPTVMLTSLWFLSCQPLLRWQSLNVSTDREGDIGFILFRYSDDFPLFRIYSRFFTKRPRGEVSDRSSLLPYHSLSLPVSFYSLYWGSVGCVVYGFYSFIVVFVKQNHLRILPWTDCLEMPVNHLTAPGITCYFSKDEILSGEL
jgi:hypothetical protein